MPNLHGFRGKLNRLGGDRLTFHDKIMPACFTRCDREIARPLESWLFKSNREKAASSHSPLHGKFSTRWTYSKRREPSGQAAGRIVCATGSFNAQSLAFPAVRKNRMQSAIVHPCASASPLLDVWPRIQGRQIAMVKCRSAVPHHLSSDFLEPTAESTTIGVRPCLIAIRSKQVLLKLLR